MAEVYLAKCFGVAGFERLVALKRILPTIAEDDEFIAMFIDEAKIAGQLSHANVAQIFDLGKINNSYFIAMEYISGHDLRALWDRMRDKGGLPLELACYVVQRLCEGLDYAHRRRDNRGRPLGIIHRDVSPQNVLLSYDGDIKVIDFGIAKAANRMVRTQTGILKGKFAYMAPEQARGEVIDHRADIFAIGVMLYELVTGERAFKADSDFALLEKVRRVDIIPPRKLRTEAPRDLERIIYKAMSKDPADRYAWASAMRADLDRFMVDHDLGYNKAELAAYVTKTFRTEHEEETRRLKLYQSYKPKNHDGALDEQGANGRSDEQVASNATVVRSDPSGEAGRSHESTKPQPPSPGASLPESVPEATGEGESEQESASEEIATDLKLKPARVRRISSGDIVPWEEAEGAPVVVEKPGETRIDVERPQLSSAHDDSAPTEDATMVDSNPVGESAEEDPSLQLPSVDAGVERRREGTRPDVRGSSLGQVLGSTSPALAALERERAKRPVADLLPSARPLLDVDVRAKNGASRAEARVETDAFREARPIAPARSSTMVVAATAAAAVIALLAGIIVGWSASRGGAASNTFIVVTPGPAAVKLGDKQLCKQTPCAVDLPRGEHVLVFEKDGIGPVERKVEVSGLTSVIDVRLEPRVQGLRLITNPPGAQVWLDEKRLDGATPMTLPELTVGDEVKLKIAFNDEYDLLEELLDVHDTKGAPLSYDLPAKQTEWELRAIPEDAVLFIDDARPRVGRAKETLKRGETRILSVRRPGCEGRVMTLSGDGKRKGELPVALVCQTFDARITVNGPKGLDVEVDGIPLARRIPLRELPVPAGEHLVVVRKRGRATPYVVEVDPGQTATVNAKPR